MVDVGGFWKYLIILLTAACALIGELAGMRPIPGYKKKLAKKQQEVADKFKKISKRK